MGKRGGNVELWRFDPFSRLMPSRFSVLNPFRWSKRAMRVSLAALFLVLMPIYAFVSMQPASSVDMSGYPVLSLPGIDLETPVEKLSLDDRRLIAPPNIAGSYTQNDYKTLIIGHSSTVFENLENVRTGQILTYDGYDYAIQSVETVAKPNIDMAEVLAAAPVDTIVIMTCAGTPLPDQDATHRLLVTATRSIETQYAATYGEDTETLMSDDGAVLSIYLDPKRVVSVNNEVEI